MSQAIRNGSTCLALLVMMPVFYADATRASASGADPVQADATERDGESERPKQFSVAPLDHIEYPEDRPPWVDHVPSLIRTRSPWSSCPDLRKPRRRVGRN